MPSQLAASNHDVVPAAPVQRLAASGATTAPLTATVVVTVPLVLAIVPLGAPVAVDALDGVRVTLAGGDVVHFRASGNAPELRCYAEAPGEIEAAELVRRGLSLAEAHL